MNLQAICDLIHDTFDWSRLPGLCCADHGSFVMTVFVWNLDNVAEA
jgi:hypothetical protein